MNYPARLALDWLLIVATLALADWLGPWSWWPALIVIGSRQQAIGEIGHMAMHNRRPWLCHIAFGGIGVSRKKYTRFHMPHHRHLGDRELDPEVAVQEMFWDRWVKPRKLDLLADAMGLHIDEAIVTLGRITTPASMGAQAVAIAAMAWFWPIVLLFPVAAVTGLLMVHRLRSWGEHRHLTEPGRTLPDEDHWWEFWRPHGCGRHDSHHNPRRA